MATSPSKEVKAPQHRKKKNFRTDAGQGKNQSMTQFEINPGNDLHRNLNLSPDGDMASTRWRLFLHLLT